MTTMTEPISQSARPLGPLVPPPHKGDALRSSEHKVIRGQHVTLRPLVPADADALFPLVGGEANAYLFDYLTVGPFPGTPAGEAALRDVCSRYSASRDPLIWAILKPSKPNNTTSTTIAAAASTSTTKSDEKMEKEEGRSEQEGQEKEREEEGEEEGQVVGWCGLCSISPQHRAAEIGPLLFAAPLQRTPGATEVSYLLARHAFEDLACRRLAWRTNNLNDASKRAAVRLGFSYEGVARRDMIVRGRSRDTVWFAMVDEEWFGGGGDEDGDNGGRRGRGCGEALRRWLDPGNFAEEGGGQRRRLEDMRAEVV